MLSARLCRVCCKKKPLDGDDDAHETTTGTSRATRRMTTTKEGEDTTGEGSDRPGKPDDDDEPTLVFPDKLPDGTQVRPVARRVA